ncbi:HK97 gp10 family phage protein [Bacillus paranthracis]|uniref:HK97 gp10 family phage protein n=1 Tax=Bacillus cereus group TaxID=86661 RepID=UPI001E369733|nr:MULTISPECIES: HK97 gp10 family phage protein [Bacillus cereus group]MCC2429870.1 HK97 gp10 family phage protein [Bacillus paranthracis]MCU5390498.1 HK97 gp10 family phage protein [Bacillus paranthracis]MDA1620153.1 HK97 gp10 family phage protein [Bacillus cereus group sp. TH204-1LC]
MASIDSLANDIARELQRYGKEVEEKLEVEKEEVSKNLVDELRQKSPKKTGKYRKGWRKKKVGNAIVVHNALKPQLTHLLEKGHAKANGGRVPAQVHIAPAEEKAINEFIERVERAIQQ